MDGLMSITVQTIINTGALSDTSNRFCQRCPSAGGSFCTPPQTLHVTRYVGPRARCLAISQSGSTEAPVRWIWALGVIGLATDRRPFVFGMSSWVLGIARSRRLQPELFTTGLVDWRMLSVST